MRLSKTEKTILEAFRFQMMRHVRAPMYTASMRSNGSGKRHFAAAELLVKKGLAKVTERDSVEIGRAKIGKMYLTIEPCGDWQAALVTVPRKRKKEAKK